METLIAGAAAALIGVLSGQALTVGINRTRRDVSRMIQRMDYIEKVIPTLITRTEVADVINKVPPLVSQAVQEEMNGIGIASVQQQVAPPRMGLSPELEAIQRQNQAAMQNLNDRLKKFTEQMPPPA